MVPVLAFFVFFTAKLVVVCDRAQHPGMLGVAYARRGALGWC